METERSTEPIRLTTPIGEKDIAALKVGDLIEVQGRIYCGRDAVLPKLADMFEAGALHQLGLTLEGSLIFHTAVSPAGIGPTTSNKLEIEQSIPALSRAGVKIHLGKGSLGAETAAALKRYNSIFAVTPPLTALFSRNILSKRVAAFPEEGMEAFFELEVTALPAIVAIAHGENLFESLKTGRAA
ncbi:MAG: fumarate hydratase C-terminal domain-containing protein [Deltaproteobacteria bacterium]|nr:fumarate hydratase C-terminal domain-containing protein [Deltaproteobacteria bacterium]